MKPTLEQFLAQALARDLPTLSLLLPFAKEFIRREEHPYFHYEPDDNEKRNQLAFHSSQKRVRFCFGGNQSGKSKAIAHEVGWFLTGEHPYQKIKSSSRIYVVSASYRTIQEGVYRHLKQILPEWLVEHIGPQIPGWQIPAWILMRNGHQVDFLSAEGREDARRKIQAAEIDLAVVDEEVDQLIWEELQARRLARDGRIIIAATLVRSEPWCLDLEDRGETGDPDIDIFRFSTYRARDCGHVSASVVREMECLLTEEERQVRLEGRSRRYEGLVYPGFTAKHVCEPFEIPADWTRYCALDPGWRVFAVLWIAVAPDGKYVIYREVYETAKHFRDIANKVKAAEGYELDPATGAWRVTPKTEKMRVRWIDPSSFGHHETGELRVGSLLAAPPYSLYCAPALNDLEAGIEMCARALMPGLDGVPQMRVFKTCRNFIKEIRSYRRPKDSGDTNKNERRDQPIKRRDHALDCWRYMTLGGLHYAKPVDPRFRPPTEDELQNPFSFTLPLAELQKEHWRGIVARQMQKGHQPVHCSGLGSEY